jgi:hypothetical protein
MKIILRNLSRFILIALVCSVAHPAFAEKHEVHSCYDAISIPSAVKPPVVRRLYVLVDQTVVFNTELKQQIDRRIQEFLKPGDEVLLISFSAYARGRYADVLLDGVLDTPLTPRQRFFTGKNLLKSFDLCLAEQNNGLRYLVDNDLLAIFSRSSSDLPNTELVGTLHLLSEQIGREPDSAARFILIASDMIEYSGISDFYARGALRLIDPVVELDRVRKAGMITNFHGAKVYVIGGALSTKGDYQPIQQIEALESFWKKYFAESNATLEAFGAPTLVYPIASHIPGN